VTYCSEVVAVDCTTRQDGLELVFTEMENMSKTEFQHIFKST